MIVAFTGHRPNELGGYELPNPTYIHVCQQLEKVLTELKPEKAISGMALGVDQWAANICFKLGIPFVAAMPFLEQDSVWPEASKKTFRALLNKAAEQVIVSEGGYTAAKMQVRNEWMVDHCDVLIAVYNGADSGGTFNCIKYAQGIGKKIIFIDPNSHE
jgi:uncharacterized phage-like protein YoqJ